MNRVELIGNLTQDPAHRQSNAGTSVTRLRLALTRPRRDGEEPGADYVDITTFGAQADSCQQYLRKGRAVAVEGHLRHSEWEQDGTRRQRLEVIAERVQFLTNPTRTPDTDPEAVGVAADESEDIPF